MQQLIKASRHFTKANEETVYKLSLQTKTYGAQAFLCAILMMGADKMF